MALTRVCLASVFFSLKTATTASAAVGSLPASNPCVVSAGARTFDLSELRTLRFTSQDRGASGWVYAFSACSNVTPSSAGANCAKTSPAAVLQATDGACHSLGTLATRKLSALECGITLSFSGGDRCGAEGTPRSTLVIVQCDDIPEPVAVRAGHGATGCSYSLRVRARAGCALECGRDGAGAVCGGTANGVCVADSSLDGRASCSCAKGRSGAACAETVEDAVSAQEQVSGGVTNDHSNSCTGSRFSSAEENLLSGVAGAALALIVVYTWGIVKGRRSALTAVPARNITALLAMSVIALLTLVAWSLLSISGHFKGNEATQVRLSMAQVPPRVVLAVTVQGEKHMSVYNRFIRASHEAYASRNGYELRLITSRPRHPKLTSTLGFDIFLLPNETWASGVDYIILLDSDIYITSSAPSLGPVLAGLGHRIGAIDEFTQPTGIFEDRVRVNNASGWERSPREYYAAHGGYVLETRHMLNGGFIIVQPSLHREFLLRLYERHANASLSQSFHFQQTTFGYELLTNDMWAPVPRQWNALWILTHNFPGNMLTLHEFASQNFGVHFANGESSIHEDASEVEICAGGSGRKYN